MAKPGDFFVSVTDLFSIILPGMATAYILLKVEEDCKLDLLSLRSPNGKTEGYVAFLVVAYLLGHLIDMIGATILDWMYDRIYVRWRVSSFRAWLYGLRKRWMRAWSKARRDIRLASTKREPFNEWVATWKRWLRKPGGHLRAEWSRVLNSLFGARRKSTNILLHRAEELSQPVMPSGDSVYQWSRAWVEINSPAVFAETERLQANSKFFRGFVIVSILAAVLSRKFIETSDSRALIACVVLAFVAFLRYADLRWKAVQHVYRCFIALHSVTPAQFAGIIAEKTAAEDREGDSDDSELPDGRAGTDHR